MRADAWSAGRVAASPTVATPSQRDNAVIEILRAELEQLFELEELLSLSRHSLGFDPEEIGGSSAKGSFVKALTEHCIQQDAVEALCDAVLASKEDVDAKVWLIAANGLLADEELAGGQEVGEFLILRKIGEGRSGVSYQARRDNSDVRLKALRPDVLAHPRAMRRFAAYTRLVNGLDHAALPNPVELLTLEGRPYLMHDYFDGQPLAARIARGGPMHINEARPLLEAILDALAKLHARRLSHGNLHLDNVLIIRTPDGVQQLVLLDAGSDRLQAGPRVTREGSSELPGTLSSPKTAAPEVLRGAPTDARSDVYSFGAMFYEIVTGRTLFAATSASECAVGHLAQQPEAASSAAPRGWVSRELDEFLEQLLAKDPDHRPPEAAAVLEELEAIGRAAASKKELTISDADFDELVDALIADPTDQEAALALEATLEEGASASRVGEAFSIAAEQVSDSEEASAAGIKQRLLFRAARMYESAEALGMAEQVYVQLTELDPTDEVALAALEATRRRAGKHEEVVEMLLRRSEEVKSGKERARVLAEIGTIYAQELADHEQALVAFTQAFCEDPHHQSSVRQIEKLAGSEQKLWEEVLGACVQATSDEQLPDEEKNVLYCTMATWYTEQVSRPDLALAVYQAVLSSEPSNDTALQSMIQIYRKAQQWFELGSTLLRRADATGQPALARDLRAEAAELLEHQLNDSGRARDLYEQILAEDPGHVQAIEALGRIYERLGEHEGHVKILERQGESQHGDAKVHTMCRIAEIFEDRLKDDGEAVRRYEAAVAENPHSLDALLALDRLYSKAGQYKKLLKNLKDQIRVAATPRRKIKLWERVAGIHDEEFLDHAQAAEAWEATLEIDSAYEPALIALPRHYRALDRWEDVASIYQQHIKLLTDDKLRLELTLLRAQVLEEQIGSPERAVAAYELAVAIEPQHAAALDALARLRETAGDATAALDAIVALADQAETPRGKAEQYFRAARMLEEREDLDRAIEYYKLALDQVPDEPLTAEALRRTYLARGDTSAAIQLLEREFDRTEGDATRAKLAAEVAVLSYEVLKDDPRAEDAAKRAVSHDPTNLDGLLVLGHLAFESKRYLEASKHYEQVAHHADQLEKGRATRVLVRYVDALSQAGSTEQALVPMETLMRIAPDNAQALERVARVTFEHGSIKRAAELYGDLFQRFGDQFRENADALYRYGEALRRTGELDAAIRPLEDASDVDPGMALPLIALAKVYEDKNDWDRVVRVKTRHLDIESAEERVSLLIEIGDIATSRLNDRARATKSYVAALEDQPDDRRLLTKLMQLYSEDQDWERLIEVVLRLADFVDEPQQRAKYLMTAAMVSSRQTGDLDQALLYLDQVLDTDPANTKALEESLLINREGGDFDRVEELLKRRLDYTSAVDDKAGMLETFLQLGELYERDLGWMDKAIDAYEAAQTLEPDNQERAEMLAQLYASEPEKYLDKAVAAQMQFLAKNTFVPEPYKALRRLYTETKQADAAWCLCQTLSVLHLAEPDEERFFKRMRSETAAPAQRALSDEDWLTLVMHSSADPLLTSVFGLIEAAIIGARSKSLEELGYAPEYRIDLPRHPYPMSQTIHYAAGVLGMDPPPTFQNPNDPTGLSFLHAQTPAIVLGKAAMATEVPAQAAAFIASRHLAYFRPGMYVRHLIASGTGLKSWLFAAIKLISPQFPVAPELEGPVKDAYGALDKSITGKSRDHLARIVAKLLQGGGALDLKRWVAGIDLTADRVGVIVSHDLETALEIIKASDEGSSSVPLAERRQEAIIYSVSQPFFAVRQKLGITIDS
jgi:tetratricopeptide (TPR) repeat protein